MSPPSSTPDSPPLPNDPSSCSQPSPPIHILGLGNLGLLIASSLSQNEVPVTLLFHRSSLLSTWEACGRQITITRNSIPTTTSNYTIELVHLSPGEEPLPPIQYLIITTKAQHTVAALEPLVERLTSNTIILFVQNGMGSLEQVTSQLFPDPSTRPTFLTSVTTHGAYALSPFHTVHASSGTLSVGLIPRLRNRRHLTIYLRESLRTSPFLDAVTSGISENEILALQLQKLVINSVINPLTVIYNCLNGAIFSFPEAVSLSHSLIEEASRVILKLPQLQSSSQQSSKAKEEIEEIRKMFIPQALENKVKEIVEITKDNNSSMKQDVGMGRETEIQYINGWVVRKGEELGVQTEANKRVVEAVTWRAKVVEKYTRDSGL